MTSRISPEKKLKNAITIFTAAKIAEGIFATSPVSIKLRIIGTPRIKEKRKKKKSKRRKKE